MPQTPSLSPDFVVGLEPTTPRPIAGDCARLVLDRYTAALRGSGRGENAFEAAVRAYREHNPACSPGAAARAVAEIVCRML